MDSKAAEVLSLFSANAQEAHGDWGKIERKNV